VVGDGDEGEVGPRGGSPTSPGVRFVEGEVRKDEGKRKE